MLPRFLAKDAVNSFWFYDYDRQGWVTNEPAVANDPMFKPDEPPMIEPKLNHEQPHHQDEEQLAFYQAGVVANEPAPIPPEPPLRRRI